MSAVPAIGGTPPPLDEVFDLAALAAASVEREPYEHLVVRRCIAPSALAAINRDYPRLPGPGAHPLDKVALDGAVAHFWALLGTAAFRDLIAEKFGLSLADTAVMGTIRSECEAADGAIHTDSKTKIITILFYFNEQWPHPGGRLRLLRNGTDLGNFAAEVEPSEGTMLAFRRSESSWHGHLPHTGERRMLQMHFVDAKRIARNEQKRQSIAWRLKKFFSLG